jgi:hypothetical protein
MLPGKRNSTGAIYVLQGPPPAGTPFVGGIAVSPDGAIYVSQAFTPPFSPASLFASGEQGVWYDPSDLSTMFQDSAGTTPVTADGQPVGLILDKSGRGNHASQATAAARPLYKTSGGLHWLQFDGVNNKLETAIDFTGTDKISIFSGTSRPNNIATIIAEFGGAVQNGSFYWVSGTEAADPTQIAGINAPSVDTAVCTVTHDIATDLSRIRRNAVYGTDGAGDKGVGTFGNYPLYIGSRAGTSLFFNGHIYSIIFLGRLAATQEITDTETWVAAKTGVVLP